jgi:DNA-binding SARP family transcriptional activator/TolB-like protein
MTVLHGGKPAKLPQSRKVKALLGFLAMAPRPVLRPWLCDLLWDAVSDPRGELRWCLSKVRRVLGDRSAVLVCDGEWVSIDRSMVEVDALRFLTRANNPGPACTIADLTSIEALHTGDLLGDLRPGITRGFDNWLEDRRQAVSEAHQAILRRLADELPVSTSDRLHFLRLLIGITPFDDAAHIELLRSLVARHERGDAEQHLSATLASYRQEGIDESSLLHAWQAMRRAACRPERPHTTTLADREPGSAAARPDCASSPPLVAVAPFTSADPDLTEPTRNLTHDVTIGLARLRSPFIVSESSAFVLGERGLSAHEIGLSMRADYVVTGTVWRDRAALRIELELMGVESSRLIWSDEFMIPHKDMPAAANEIGALVTAALAAEIELTECHRSLSKPVASLNAWEALHRGLWHLHRFTRKDNEIAIGFFNRAAELDPSMSRCHAALSYAHWMNAFAFRPADKDRELRNALDAAGRSLHADPRDPAALWSISRALWMSNEESASSRAIEQAIDISPSYVAARHSRSFCECQTGDPNRALNDSRLAERLSPYDPWRYAMYGVQALANLRLGSTGAAAEAARRLTCMPNAHVQARGLATLVLAACGEVDQACSEIAVVRGLHPSYSLGDFFAAYHVAGDLRARFAEAGMQIGLHE